MDVVADPILDPLNPQQREAVTHGDGPLLILAGAGSGKTRVLTHRVAYLIRDLAVPAKAILAVTFTNKAAKEMRERLDRLVGKERLAELTVGTFHGFCARLLRREGPVVGIDRSFAIYDEADQRAVLRQHMAETNASEKVFAPGAISNVISSAKNELKGPADLTANPKGQLDRIAAIVWKRYDELLRENNAVDFDDLLLLACRVFETSDGALEQWQDRYQHILVDEYQDTNRAQYVLLRYLAGFKQNLAVVGDDDQSVFSWRGADVRNILDFERDYPNAKVVKLEQNYRSTQRILDAAHSVVRNNAARKEKKLWTDRLGGSDIVVMQAYDESHEAELVAREIERLQREGEAHGTRDVAVLYRTNAQSRAIEDTFRAFGLAYQIVGGVSFYQRREVKDTLAYLRLVGNPHDAFALARVLNTPPRGLGDKTRSALLATAREHEIREGEERWANVQELRTLAEDYVALPQEEQLPSFLEEIALVSDVDEYKDAKPAATLITMHAVKGLEFPVVFMTGMEEGVFPHIRAIESGKESELEEERRLCYVGITRAKDRAYLTYARRRSLFGRTNMNPPSRFLTELPSEGVELRGTIETQERDTWAELDGERDRTRYEDRKQARRDAMLAGLPGSWTGRATKERTALVSETRFRAGDRVLHPSLGEGMVVSSVARDDDEEVTVAFPDKGVKKLMASFAKLARA